MGVRIENQLMRGAFVAVCPGHALADGDEPFGGIDAELEIVARQPWGNAAGVRRRRRDLQGGDNQQPGQCTAYDHGSSGPGARRHGHSDIIREVSIAVAKSTAPSLRRLPAATPAPRTLSSGYPGKAPKDRLTG